jgi:biopolymer transport protein ExbD
MRIRDDDGLLEPEFSMAPLIDIVFQLLIFFMVATTYTKQEKELGIELPNAPSAQSPEAKPDEIVINVFRDGRVSVFGRDVTREALVGALVDAAHAQNDVPVTIRGDRLVHHEDVVAVMDACGSAGLTNLTVGTLDG